MFTTRPVVVTVQAPSVSVDCLVKKYNITKLLQLLRGLQSEITSFSAYLYLFHILLLENDHLLEVGAHKLVFIHFP